MDIRDWWKDTLKECDALLKGTTDVQEACIRGYNAGYQRATEEHQKKPIKSCDGCMGASFGDCESCEPINRPNWKMDTPVFVRNSKKDPWVFRHFFKWTDNGDALVWAGGTSSTNNYYGEMSTWKYIKRVQDTLVPEINLIKDGSLKDFALYCETKIPEYFFHVPASSSGQYHPKYALGEGGLLRHTKAAVKIANDLLGLEQNCGLDHDVIIFALIFHDAVKQGSESSGHTEFLHPKFGSTFINRCYQEYPPFVDVNKIKKICDCIHSHMGEWNTNRYSLDMLPKPISPEQQFVHMCDYLASRKYLEVEL